MAFEIQFLDFLYSLHSPVLNEIMIFITSLGDHGLLWIALGLFFCFVPKYRKMGFMILVALIIDLITVDVLLKPLIHRERPYTGQDIELLIGLQKDYSFPSGHTASSFASATAIFYNNKKFGIIALIIASLIAFSRMYLYVHYPTDILGGFAFGIVFAVASILICNFVAKRITDKNKY